ncbi:MAG: hypothetical protein NT040_07945 [Bacteroidetes bacterium]|nr:hypothetical protein [Bacteroidota bacterium]
MSAMLPMLVSFVPQESRVNQKKIERERARKQKQARADYEKAVRRHNIRQSKSTRASMKKMKKESKKVTPNIH